MIWGSHGNKTVQDDVLGCDAGWTYRWMGWRPQDGGSTFIQHTHLKVHVIHNPKSQKYKEAGMVDNGMMFIQSFIKIHPLVQHLHIHTQLDTYKFLPLFYLHLWNMKSKLNCKVLFNRFNSASMTKNSSLKCHIVQTLVTSLMS